VEPSPEDSEEGASSKIVPLPPEEMRTLMVLARKEKITVIHQRIAKIEKIGDEYRSFAVELGRVAKSFDMGQITDFLQPYLEKTE